MNQHATFRDLSDTEARIIDATIDVLLKFGPRKTTMNDIAEAADLTRQTVYVSFGNKDAVLAETVRYIGGHHLSQVAVAWDYCPTLMDKLKAYSRIVVLDQHDEDTGGDDPQELISAYSKVGRSAYDEVRARHADMWAEQLTPSEAPLATVGLTPAALARFIVTTSFNLKRMEVDRGLLHDQMNALNAAVIALTTQR